MRVLVFHKGGIGDVVFGLPLLADLKHGLPEAHLTVLTHRDGAQVLGLCPWVDQVAELGAERERWGVRAALEALGGERFDLAVSTVRSPRAAWVLWKSGARIRVGFGGGPERLLYTHVAPVTPFEVTFSRRFQRLARALQVPEHPAGAALRVAEPARARAREALTALGWDGTRALVAGHAGGGWPTKRWPVEHWATTAARLFERRGAQLLLQGGGDDRERSRAIVSQAPPGAVVDATGDGVGEAIAKASWCQAALGLDSGLSHAAAALGLPTVFLFGPNNPASIALGPWQRLLTVDLPCRPCNRAGKMACPEVHHRCLVDLDPEQALAALDEVWPAT